MSMLLQMPTRFEPTHYTSDDVVLRLLTADDIVPDEFNTGIKQYDYHWVWAAIESGVAVALVIASPYHDAVFFGGVYVKPKRGVLLGLLLRKVISDVWERGFRTYFTFCSEEIEAQLIRILKRAGAKSWDAPVVPIGGAIQDLRKW